MIFFQIIGPFIVDTTAPTFSGDIQISLENQDLLVVQWGSDAFADSGDLNPLQYRYAIGIQNFKLSTSLLLYIETFIYNTW